jgi:hypothetical protein
MPYIRLLRDAKQLISHKAAVTQSRTQSCEGKCRDDSVSGPADDPCHLMIGQMIRAVAKLA